MRVHEVQKSGRTRLGVAPVGSQGGHGNVRDGNATRHIEERGRRRRARPSPHRAAPESAMNGGCARLSALSAMTLGVALHMQAPLDAWWGAAHLLRGVAGQFSAHELSLAFECPGDPQVPWCDDGPPDAAGDRPLREP
jgi:hypothetical protein